LFPRRIPVQPLLLDKEPVKFTVRTEQLLNKRHKPDVAYSCHHSFNDEARRVEMDMELQLRLMGHSVKRAIGTNAQYCSPDVLLPAAKKWVDKMWRE
jgi:hypothetical protein